MKSHLQVALSLFVIAVNCNAQLNVTYIINTSANRASISPYIYGTNGNLTGNENFAAYRLGGNRLTGYNWENNFSNAGSDYNHSSDNYLVSTLTSMQQRTPGIVALNLIDSNLGKYTLFTLPAAGYVSRDSRGSVSVNETAPSPRWRQVVNKKVSPFTLTPDTSDNFIYIDEFLNYLIAKKGKANVGGIKAYLIDNEPDLWKDTHPRIFNHALGAAELVTKSINMAKTIKDMDNTAEVYGYESYGFSGYYNLQTAPDWNTEKGAAYWYIDYYLSKMKAASIADNRRLLDVLSLHWYPEAMGDHRINDPAATTTNDNIARMQAPRSLWDSSYTENSWIATYFPADLPLIPRIFKSINQHYEYTQLAFTEYNYGDFNHVSSGIAQADLPGIFGKYGVYAANYWNMQSNTHYTAAGFKIFRNYDGTNGTFGSTSVYSKLSDKENSSIYSSINKIDESVLTLIVINKNLTQTINGQFAITSSTNYINADVWGFDANSATITSRISIANIAGNQFNYTIPALSVLLLKLKATSSGITNQPLTVPDFILSPNPASDYLKMETMSITNKQAEVDIYDITGKRVYADKVLLLGDFTKTINISMLASGIYYLSLSDGTYTKRSKFIKN